MRHVRGFFVECQVGAWNARGNHLLKIPVHYLGVRHIECIVALGSAVVPLDYE